MKTTMLLRPDMARAWAEGRKTRTQRVINRLLGRRQFHRITEFGRSDTVGYNWHFRDKHMLWNDITTDRLMALCPYGGPGDRLNLLTSWAVHSQYDKFKPMELAQNFDGIRGVIWTYFDNAEKPDWCGKLRPGRFMPKWIRKLMPKPKILSLGARRVQEITKKEIYEEGAITEEWLEWREDAECVGLPPGSHIENERDVFEQLWNSINGEKHPWDDNPWVFNIEMEGPE